MRRRRLALAALLIVAALGWPLTGPGDAALQLAALAALAGVAAIGLAFILGQARLPSLAQGAAFAIAAYVSAWVSRGLGITPLAGVVIAVATVAAVAWLVAMATRRVPAGVFGLLTLAIAGVTTSGLEALDAGQVMPATSGAIEPIDAIGGTVVGWWLACGVALVVAVLIERWRDSEPGRYGQLVRAWPNAAATAGLDPAAYRVKVVVAGSACGALAGSLWPLLGGSLSAEVGGWRIGVVLICAVVIAGGGWPWGAGLLAFALLLAMPLLGPFAGYALLVLALLALLVVGLEPGGASGAWHRLAAPRFDRLLHRSGVRPAPAPVEPERAGGGG